MRHHPTWAEVQGQFMSDPAVQQALRELRARGLDGYEPQDPTIYSEDGSEAE